MDWMLALPAGTEVVVQYPYQPPIVVDAAALRHEMRRQRLLQDEPNRANDKPRIITDVA